MAEALRRPALLLLSIVVPALVAGSLTALLVLPEEGRSEPAPVARAPAGLPSVDLAPTPRRRRPARPLGISIPAAGVQGPVDPIRAVDGQLEIPPPGRAGWFSGGPRPGEPGRAVIVSHVDSQAGPALFAGLQTLGGGRASWSRTTAAASTGSGSFAGARSRRAASGASSSTRRRRAGRSS